MSLLSIAEGFPYELASPLDPEVQGPLIAHAWAEWLQKHPDLVFTRTVGLIITRGAKVGYQGPPQFLLNKCHPSALQAPELLAADLQKQRQKDRLVQITSTPKQPFISSPLGLVPKHDGGWRRIHNLSFPHGNSINNGIPKAFGALEYTIFNEAIEALLA